MLKLHQIVLKKFILVFLILFVSIGAIVYYWTQELYISQNKNSLLQNIEILALQIDTDTDIQNLALSIRNKLGLRLTILSADGTVIAESHKEIKSMDNHRYRDEVMQSDHAEYGYKIRHSKTLNTDLLYIAKKYTKNTTTRYIRLSQELQSINQQVFALGLKTFFVLGVFFIFMLSIAYKLSGQIEREIDKIAIFLSSLTKQGNTAYISSDLSLEFSNITKLLTKVSQILAKKEKKKSKFTAKLQESNQQKDDIISAISHEFKNPIAVINGYSQTLIEDTNLNADIRQKFLEKVYKNGEKLSGLIDTLRLSIKLDSGQEKANFCSLNLHELLVDATETLQVNYKNRTTIIHGDTQLCIHADKHLFSLVLCNLIENAYKYSEDDVHIRFDAKHIQVIDTGIGISAMHLEKITNKFFRVQGNTWNNSLGLGLFLANNIIQLHKFSLDIQSKENEGSTFNIQMQ